MLTSVLHNFSRYNTTTADWDLIKNCIDASDIIFARLATANFHYDLLGELVEGFSPLPISDTSEDLIVNTYYGQYSKFVASLRATFDYDQYKKDTSDVDTKNNGGIVDKRTANNKTADDGVVDNKVADDEAVDYDDNQGESNDQNSDGDYMKEQRKLDHLERGLFFNKTRFCTLVTPEKGLLDILKGVKPGTVIFNISKISTQ